MILNILMNLSNLVATSLIKIYKNLINFNVTQLLKPIWN